MTRAEAIAVEEFRRAHVPLYNDQKLKLGVFGINCSYGLNISHAPTTYKVTWEHTSEIVRRADAMGFELALPVARWRGFGGTTDFNGELFETYTWAAGLAQATKNIMIAATSHVPTVHPIVAAKQATTIDHISNGRFALNLVMGWFTPEMEMFQGTQRAHDDRYRYGAEWLSVVKRLWTEEAAVRLRNGGFPHQAGAGPSQAGPEALSGPDQCRSFTRGQGFLRSRGRLQLRRLRQRRSGQGGCHPGPRAGAHRLSARHRRLHLGPCRLPGDRGRGASGLSQHHRAWRPGGCGQSHEGAGHREPVVQRAHRQVSRARRRRLGNESDHRDARAGHRPARRGLGGRRRRRSCSASSTTTRSSNISTVR